MIAEEGTYEQLMEHDGAFAKFLKTYLTEHNSDSDSDEEGNTRHNARYLQPDKMNSFKAR